MNIKRRSNWYIYLITFVVTGILLFIISGALLNSYYSSRQVNNNAQQQPAGTTFIPDSNYDFTMLIMMSETSDDAPDEFMTLTYRAENSQFTLMPYLSNSDIGGAVLKSAYSGGGADAVMSALSSAAQTGITKYIRFTKSTAVQFFDMVGNTRLSVPKELKHENKDNTLTIIKEGTDTFSGSQMYDYLTFPDFGEKDVQYSCKVQATAISSFVNQNFADVSDESLDEYMDFITGFTDTNITREDYLAKKAALLYTFGASPSPCDYYIPYGDLSGNDYVISEESIKSITDKINR